MRFIASGVETEPLCPLCGEAAGIIKYEYPDEKIIQCCACGLWRTCPCLPAEKLEEYYRANYYSPEIERRQRYEEWRDKHLDVWRTNAALVDYEARRRGYAQPLALLDLGCGHGFFLEECVKLGLAARGLEPNPDAAAYAREKLRMDVRPLRLDELPADECYDVITLWSVLEHVPDPLRTMRQVCAHLRPGGMAWVMTPNTNAWLRHLKGAAYFNFLNKTHLTHFNRRNLRGLLTQAGLRDARRYIHWGGGGRSGLGACLQYAARLLCAGTELRFIAEK
jgi:2-polyprenyl-3-methyl-5-hydroxy-6-metoxy-1,4-benzoquinol methylase